MIADNKTAQQKNFRPGMIAQELNLDDAYVSATKMRFQTFLYDLCDTPNTGFSYAKLRTLSAIIGRTLAIAKHHFDDDLIKLFEAWQDNTLIISFALQSYNHEEKLGDDGCRLKGGFFGFLKENLPETTVTDEWGQEHHLPLAPRREVNVRAVFTAIAELDVLEFHRNGRNQSSSVAIKHLPNLLILGEVVEQMITHWKCYEAVPEWHKAIRHDYNQVFGYNKYNRIPADGSILQGYHTYEAMVEDCETVCPAIAQDPVKLAAKGDRLGLTYVDRCCRKYYKTTGDVVEGYVKIGSRMIAFGKSTLGKSLVMCSNAAKAIAKALKEGVLSYYGLAPAPRIYSSAELFG